MKLRYQLVIDTAEGIKRFGGKQDRYMKSLIKFAEGLPGDRLDWQSPELPREVHSIKGIAGNLGVTSLYNTAIAYEEVIRAGMGTEEAYALFYDACAGAGKAILEQFADGTQASDRQLPEGDVIEYTALMSMLRNALLEGDIATAEDAVAAVKSKNWTNIEDASQICKLVEAYDFEAALRLLR